MVSSFLADGPEYNIYGQPAVENEFLFNSGGLSVRAKNAMDQFLPISSGDASGTKLNVRNTQVAYKNYIFPRTQSVTLNTPTQTLTQQFTFTPGYTTAAACEGWALDRSRSAFSIECFAFSSPGRIRISRFMARIWLVLRSALEALR